MTTTNGTLRCCCLHIKHVVTTEEREALKAQLVTLAKSGDHLAAQAELNRLGPCHTLSRLPTKRVRKKTRKRRRRARDLPTMRWSRLDDKTRATIKGELLTLWDTIAHDVFESRFPYDADDDRFDSLRMNQDEVWEVVLDNLDTIDSDFEIVNEFFRIDRENQVPEMEAAVRETFYHDTYGH